MHAVSLIVHPLYVRTFVESIVIPELSAACFNDTSVTVINVLIVIIAGLNDFIANPKSATTVFDLNRQGFRVFSRKWVALRERSRDQAIRDSAFGFGLSASCNSVFKMVIPPLPDA